MHENSIFHFNSDDALKAAFEVLMYVDVDDIASDQDMETITHRMDSAMEVLVWNAVANYGFAPRVVYGAIFKPSLTDEEHEEAIADLSYEGLQKLVDDFTEHSTLSMHTTSHRIISVSPFERPGMCTVDGWTIGFKSNRIARKVAVAMKKEEDRRLRFMYMTFRHVDETAIK